jgi:hypothetical protein
MPPDKRESDWLNLFLEAGFEPEQDIRDVVAHLDKRLFEPEPIERRTFLEGYIEVEYEVHVHIGIPSGFNKDATSEFCAVFKKAGGLNVNELKSGIASVPVPKSVSSKGLSAESEFVVLVPIGETSEDGEWVTLRTLPSTVRLQPLDECNVGLAHPSDLFPKRTAGTSSFLFEGGRIVGFERDEGIVVEDGELGAVGGFPVTPDLDQLPGDMVEGRAPVVRNIPDDGTPRKGRLLPNANSKDDAVAGAVAGLWVGFGDDFIRVALQELPDQELDHLSVVTTPTKLRKGSV